MVEIKGAGQGERGFLIADVDFGEPGIRSCEDDASCHIYIDE